MLVSLVLVLGLTGCGGGDGCVGVFGDDRDGSYL